METQNNENQFDIGTVKTCLLEIIDMIHEEQRRARELLDRLKLIEDCVANQYAEIKDMPNVIVNNNGRKSNSLRVKTW